MNFCQYVLMTLKDRIELIRKAHVAALAEQGEVELEGVLEVSTRDIEDETNGWTPSEEVDFDQDENLVDMTAVSPELKAVFS